LRYKGHKSRIFNTTTTTTTNNNNNNTAQAVYSLFKRLNSTRAASLLCKEFASLGSGASRQSLVYAVHDICVTRHTAQFCCCSFAGVCCKRRIAVKPEL
jgi:hypothetical protein